ncbi:kelch-like protein 28 isoform X4 [Patella vulgata]|uniref:kelch-like protein 28 isoform X4 n=1 Tax=Patella vulgata TaxID=6465 RepID=UPI00217F3048|nr:kelch-like protein 28 isoform X4 [Patella vulgata]
MFSYQVQYHHQCLSQGLTNLWLNGKHTDVVIYVEDRMFCCHRAILASMSAYFDAMFTSDMKESREGEVHLKNMKACVFESILKYIYKGDTSEMFPASAVDILYASSLLQIGPLQELCEKYFCDNMTIQSCIEIWRLSCSMNCISLQDYAWTFYMDNFSEVCRTEEFLELTKEELLLTMNDDNMNVENEEIVSDAMLRWIESDRKRIDYLLELFHNLRLALMSHAYIDCLLRRKAFISENSECRSLLEQMKHVSARAEIVYGQPHIFRERNEQVLVMVDGRRQEVSCYSIIRKKCFSLAKFPYFADGKAACTNDEDIFVCGGTSSYGSAESRLVRFETRRNRWEECPMMQESRCYHELVSVGASIYTIGGFDPEEAITSIEKYDIDKKRWMKCGDLVVPVGGMSAATLNDIIFIFGGKKNRGERRTPFFQCFNTKTGLTTLLGNLPISTCWSKALAIDHIIYIFCPDGNVMASTLHSFPAIVSVIKNFDCKNFSVVSYRGDIMIMQAGDNKHHDILRLYDPGTGSVSVVRERLPRSLCDSDWLKVNINRCHLRYECSHTTHR